MSPRRTALAQWRALLQMEAALQRLRIRQSAQLLRQELLPSMTPGRTRTWLRVLKIAWLAAVTWRRLRSTSSPAS